MPGRGFGHTYKIGGKLSLGDLGRRKRSYDEQTSETTKEQGNEMQDTAHEG